MGDFYPVLTSEPSERDFLVKFVGGTTAVTKVIGRGLTTTWISTGIVELAWSTNQEVPGTFVGPKAGVIHATTPANVKGYSFTCGDYNVSTRKLRVSIYDASNNLVDLAALQWLTFTVVFLSDGLIGP
jgi:hypothetical protein